MNFSEALLNLKNGQKVYRTDWNGHKIGYKMFVVMESSRAKSIQTIMNNEIYGKFNRSLYIFVEGEANSYLPTNIDLFAEDWELLT